MASGAADSLDIVDVAVREFDPVTDVRGALYEIHRDAWELAPRPVQWNFITTRPGALRGVHVHCRRWDYMIILEGRATIGLNDLRRAGGSFGRSAMIDVDGASPSVVTIPRGVAHGVFAETALRYLYGLTVAWDGTDDELGCRYDDPALALDWPATDPVLLPRDRDLPDFATMLRQYEKAVGPAPASP